MFRFTRHARSVTWGGHRPGRNGLAWLLSLLLSASVMAEDAADAATGAHDARLRPVQGKLQAAQYDALSRYNRRIVRGMIETSVASLGAPPEATRALAAIAALATEDPRIGFNGDDTLGLQLRDLAHRERGLYLYYELSW